MKIVVRAPNWIGDAVLALPALEQFRQNSPGMELWVAAHGWVRDVFEGHPRVDGTIALPPLSGWNAFSTSVRLLKPHGFDAGLLLTNSFSSALLFTAAGIPERWGYSRDGRRLLLTRSLRPESKPPPNHQVFYYMHLISALGFGSSNPKLSLPLTEQDLRSSQVLLESRGVDPEKKRVVLNPGAFFGAAKRWPPERFSELAVRLQKSLDAEILVIGSSEEEPLARVISDGMTKKAHVLNGATSLRTLAAVLSTADLVVSNDSGPMHIANALKTPLVAIFGPTDPRLTGPFQAPCRVVRKDVSCWPCSHRKCPTDHRCMTRISTEDVASACHELLAENNS